MARFEVEFLRSNVTVGQFLSYVRAQLRKRGLDELANGIDYDNFVSGDWSCKVDHKERNDEAYVSLGVEYEEVKDMPYDKKSYQRKANGAISNEIVEFIFDDEKTGRGYYYAVEDEVESVESVELVDNDENNSCDERATANKATKDADNLNREKENNMRKTMKFANQNEYEKWVDEQQEHCEHTDEIVCVVDDGRELTAELTTTCNEPVTAVFRLFEGLDEPELDGWQDVMAKAVSNGVYSDSADGDWECVPVNAEYYHGYYVRLTVYRSQVDEEEAKEIALSAIAREFAKQQKYYKEKWSYDHPDTSDCLVQYWYDWKDDDGVRYKDCVEIFLSDACHAAGVDFDVVDDGDIEGRMLEEMVDRGYTVDEDNEVVIDDDADAYAICVEMDEVRSDLWEQAQNEAEQARDELCEHEDLSEPWFRELCEKMLAKVNATLAE